MIRAGTAELLRVLSDGRWHDPEALKRLLGLDRYALSGCLDAAVELAAPVERDERHAIRLATPFVPLDAAGIRAALAVVPVVPMPEVRVLPMVDSTNAELLRDPEPGCIVMCLAEAQSAGRGRTGRNWVSPYGANLYLSLKWPLVRRPPDGGAMSLVCGIAAATALREGWQVDVGLKWPNDLLVGGRKLGGILVEQRVTAAGSGAAVIGVGLNVSMRAEQAAGVDQPWTALCDVVPQSEPIDRNRLAADLVSRLVPALQRFVDDGFEPFRADWDVLDLVRGRDICVRTAHGLEEGSAAGVASDGALRVRRENRAVVSYYSGDVSVRLRPRRDELESLG